MTTTEADRLIAFLKFRKACLAEAIANVHTQSSLSRSMADVSVMKPIGGPRPMLSLGAAIASAAKTRSVDSTAIDELANAEKKATARKVATAAAATKLENRPNNSKKRTDEEWMGLLPAHQFEILRKKATEDKDITWQKGKC